MARPKTLAYFDAVKVALAPGETREIHALVDDWVHWFRGEDLRVSESAEGSTVILGLHISGKSQLPPSPEKCCGDCESAHVHEGVLSKRFPMNDLSCGMLFDTWTRGEEFRVIVKNLSSAPVKWYAALTGTGRDAA